MILAAAYVRVSTDDQTEYSPMVQLAEIQDFARKNGYHIPEEFIFTDEGISGRSAEKRPAFQAMIRQARKKSNHIQYIIVHKYDRFARNKEDAVLYKALLKKDGVKVLSVKEPIPQDDKFAVIYESMLEAMAEYYSLNLAEEVKKTMVKKAEMGEWQTTAPYGYRNENKSLAIVPDEAKMVRYIFEQYAAGVSMFALSRHMNQAGCRTHRGNVFENRTIQYILNNPAYHGYMRWTPDKKTCRDFANPASIISKGDWTPIIDDTLWEQAQARLQSEKRRHSPHKRPEIEGHHWLSSMVKCSACGRSLVISQKYKCGSFSLQCGGYNHGQCHASHSITSARLIPAVLGALQEISSNPDTEAFQYTIRSIRPHTDEIETFRAMLEKSKARLRKAKEAYLNEIDTLEEYRQNKKMIESEISEWEQKISALSAASDDFDRTAFSAKIRKTVEVLKSEQPLEAKRKAFKSVVEKIVYHKKTDSISLFFVDE